MAFVALPDSALAIFWLESTQQAEGGRLTSPPEFIRSGDEYIHPPAGPGVKRLCSAHPPPRPPV